MIRVNDRVAFPRLRRMFDRVLGDWVADTLVLRLPGLLKVRSGHFTDHLSDKEKRQLFAASVRYLEIEVHSYCNRRCWFCPNSQIDRRSKRHYLPERTYRQVLVDLSSIGFRYEISFSRYNEPFGDEIIYERIAQARSFLPRSRLRANSNGDFVGLPELDRMSLAGLDHLWLTCYPRGGTPWSREHAERQIAGTAKRLCLVLRRRRETVGSRVSYEAWHNDMRITVYYPNIPVLGADRGGIVEGVPTAPDPRASPCLAPFSKIYIDYDGHVMPCCEVRSDIPSHRHASLGVLDDTAGSIFDVWTSASAARWREELVTYEPKAGPCCGCLVHEWAMGRGVRLLHRLLLGLGRSLPIRRTSPARGDGQ